MWGSQKSDRQIIHSGHGHIQIMFVVLVYITLLFYKLRFSEHTNVDHFIIKEHLTRPVRINRCFVFFLVFWSYSSSFSSLYIEWFYIWYTHSFQQATNGVKITRSRSVFICTGIKDILKYIVPSSWTLAAWPQHKRPITHKEEKTDWLCDLLQVTD